MPDREAAMVLQYEPLLGNCRWVDFISRHKSEKALIASLRAGVKRGEWHGWRLITIHREVLGNTPTISEGLE